ncbi:MAG: ribosomal protein S18-alanine N-acetyltransferase [Candidatus Margulisiibacteriota bacterium]
MIEIKKAGKNDLAILLELENLSFSNPWGENQFLESLEYFHVAKQEGKLAGFIGIQPIQDEVHILHMAVRPEFRRRGIAKKMMEFALSFPAKKWFLEVRAGNHSAQKLYESYGFKVISRRRKYYQDNDEDALIMWKEPAVSPN